MITTSTTPFERSSKRRKGFPSETHVKGGLRFVRGDKDLYEKLGRNDLLSLRFRQEISNAAAFRPADSMERNATTFFRL